MDKRDFIIKLQEIVDDAAMSPMDIAVTLLVAIAEQIRIASTYHEAAITHNADLMAKQLIAIAHRRTAREEGK